METCLQIFKLKFERSQSNRNIAVALGVSPSTVYEVLSRFKAASLLWPLPDTLSPEQLQKMLFPARGTPVTGLISPDWLYIDTELRRQGVTRQLLWMEYSAETGEMALGYSQFCRSYLKWKKCQKRSMRQTHRAGEKLFIDFCGPTVPVIDPDIGQHHFMGVHVGNGGANGWYEFRHDGNAFANGGWHSSSDARMKTDITKIDGALDKLAHIGGYTYLK
uniref:tail fiber domain-containing protein n=1 Tax=Serratia marcescens TaxID=615 RepID=UPI0024A6EC58